MTVSGVTVRLAAAGPPAELRAGLRPVVKAEHGGHDPGQLGGHGQAAGPVPVRSLPRAVRVRRGDRVSVVPNAACIAAIVPLTIMRRDARCVSRSR